MNEEAVTEIISRKPELKAAKAKLESMQPGNYCIHQSWGFGQIKDYDAADKKLVIDFEDKQGHRMDPGFCVGTMQVLKPDHLLVRKELEPAAVEDLVSNKPTELIVELLKQYQNFAASTAEIESVLARVIGPIKYKKWWTATKKLLNKDPRISVPARKTGMYVLREEPVTLEEEIIEDYNATQSAKRRVVLAEKLLETAGDHLEELRDQLGLILHTLATAVRESNQLTSAEKLKGAWIRNDFARLLDVNVEDFEPSVVQILSDIQGLDALIDELPTNQQGRALKAIKASHPADWKEICFNLLKNSSGKFTTDCINFLIENGFGDEIKETLIRWQTEQNLKEPVLLWIVKNRHSKKYADLIQDMIQPRLLNSIFFAIDYEALQSSSARRIPLADILSEDRDLIPDLLGTADSETAKDLANNLLLNQGFEELTKKSLLARFIKLFPTVQSLLESDETQQSQGLMVSKESYEKAVSELEDLVQKKIPENSKAIAEARELGDLKENSEYKMAKQDQQVLMSRRNLLEADLQKAQITDFTSATTSNAGIGSVVTLNDEDGNEVTYTILGAWDSDPANQIISYQTPLGKSLLGKTVGDEVVLKIEDTESKLTVASIARYVDLVKS
ncbi:transcription elongation factor GreA [Pelagicoccus sp. SDUM812003]|uniref:transcription elongation factor GreA n=1 Tax=Pelagicoccus sp. SDUM812003 TaxID=3041267 RepID=UPI00280EA3CE|nr:transcription elongation factor GreA [Pelagicoccus sp. SDUM812003]MDQ8203020.1 transcription elongation factor GreA [Pelagicoccus sp. SDUM812003]